MLQQLEAILGRYKRIICCVIFEHSITFLYRLFLSFSIVLSFSVCNHPRPTQLSLETHLCCPLAASVVTVRDALFSYRKLPIDVFLLFTYYLQHQLYMYFYCPHWGTCYLHHQLGVNWFYSTKYFSCLLHRLHLLFLVRMNQLSFKPKFSKSS